MVKRFLFSWEVALCSRCRTREVENLTYYCAECRRQRARDYRKNHPMTPEQRKKDNARSYAHQYKKRGKIKVEPCRICGAQKAEMHHPDYSKPLEVIWLCRICHMEEHKNNPVDGMFH